MVYLAHLFHKWPIFISIYLTGLYPKKTTGHATCTAQVRGHLCLASLEGEGANSGAAGKGRSHMTWEDSMDLSEIYGIYGLW